jgi:hypothetical protein
MSRVSNASAIQRRTTSAPSLSSSILQNPQSFKQQMTNEPKPADQPQSAGLTIHQVIALIDTRLVALEKFAKDTNDARSVQSPTNEPSGSVALPENLVTVDVVNSLIEDFNNRYDAFTQEMATLKNIVLSLQSYTMDVNKTLLEERVRILSDLGDTPDQQLIHEIKNDIYSKADNNEPALTISHELIDAVEAAMA